MSPVQRRRPTRRPAGRAGLVRTLVAAPLAVVAVAALLAGAGPAAEPGQAEAYSFGSTPWSDAYAAAQNAPRPCPISNNGLRALMLAPTYGETGAGSGTPSPMTLSRWDNQSALYSFGNANTYRAAFWHPGVGMWQFDSAGGTSSWGLATAAEHISTSTSAGSSFAAGEMAGRYCQAKSQGANDLIARAAAWAPWHACSGSKFNICNTIFDEIAANGITGNGSVGRYGGMEKRTCTRGSATTFDCWYVDPARAQGSVNWRAAGFGPAPVTAPFYVFKVGSTEVRVWLREDTGYGIDIEAHRPLGQNARSSLSWRSSSALCLRSGDVAQTFCDVGPEHAFFDEIEWAADTGVAGGYADGEFKPTAGVSRQAMAAFMYRLMASPPHTPGAPSFSDVPASHEFFTEIEWLVAQGVVEGYPDGRFRPELLVSRQAMAAFMYRLAGRPDFDAPPVPEFSDVAVGRPFYDEIHWLADQGISEGYGDGTFKPDATVTRQAMAAFLQRLSWVLDG